MYPSDESAAVRKRYEKLKASGNMKPTGALKYTCTDESQKQEIQGKIEQVKKILNPEKWNSVSNEHLLRTILDYFLNKEQPTTSSQGEYFQLYTCTRMEIQMTREQICGWL